MIQMISSSLPAFIFIPHNSKKTSYQSDSCHHQALNIMFKLFEQTQCDFFFINYDNYDSGLYK